MVLAEYYNVLQEESERVCGTALPVEIIHQILLRWGGLRHHNAASIAMRMLVPLNVNGRYSPLVPCGAIESMRGDGYVVGMLASAPEFPAYDISMTLSSERFMFPYHGQQQLTDGRLSIWKVVRTPTRPSEPFPWRRRWVPQYPDAYWIAAAIMGGMDPERAKMLAPLCAPTDMATAWTMYCRADIPSTAGVWQSMLARLRSTVAWEHVWRQLLILVLNYQVLSRLYGMSRTEAATTTGVLWGAANAVTLWVDYKGRALLGEQCWAQLRACYTRQRR
jgi:hypothetical protein